MLNFQEQKHASGKPTAVMVQLGRLFTVPPLFGFTLQTRRPFNDLILLYPWISDSNIHETKPFILIQPFAMETHNI